jgi:hypothetical protein
MKEKARTIEENREVYFNQLISKLPVKVKYEVGWLWFDIQETRGIGWSKDRHTKFTLTSEDAHLLVDAILELVPKTKPEPGL